MIPRKSRLLALLLLGLLPIGAALANPYETTLKNGLKVIVKEDRRAPTAVHMVWYKVGSMDEVDGTSGVAHALEHMMFKGTPKVGPGEFNKRVAGARARAHPRPNYNHTAHFDQITPHKRPELMALAAARGGRPRGAATTPSPTTTTPPTSSKFPSRSCPR